jgi:hypothetical protein
MIETEEQRRWWFATHPEYSWSHSTRGRNNSEQSVNSKDVDDYVDKALQFVSGPIADLLKSVKKNFGSESDWRESLDLGDLDWATEAGGRTGVRRGIQGNLRTRRGLSIRDWIHMSRSEREARASIEKELERAGANSRDYELREFAGQLVARRNKLFDPYQLDLQGRTNIQRMREGLTPFTRDGQRIILHHANQDPNGPIIELTKQEHESIEVRKDPSRIDRAEFRDFRESYWEARAATIRKPDHAKPDYYE